MSVGSSPTRPTNLERNMKQVKINVAQGDHFLWDRVPRELDHVGTVTIEVPARIAVRLSAAWDVMREVQKEIRAEVERTIDENSNSRK